MKFLSTPSKYTVRSIYLRIVSKWMSFYKSPFLTIFRHMHVHLSQNWGSDGPYEVINRSYLWLVQKLWHEMQIFLFLFFLPFFCHMHVHLSQNWGSNGHFEVLNGSKSWWPEAPCQFGKLPKNSNWWIVIFRPYLDIFLPATCLSFTKLRSRRSFWGA